uniref:Uncharacterized protein n=1 Tax=Solanum lycopersicum TaxID=4081 RepID=A0A3Q7IZU6_SOLLC
MSNFPLSRSSVVQISNLFGYAWECTFIKYEEETISMLLWLFYRQQ